MCCLFAVCIDL